MKNPLEIFSQENIQTMCKSLRIDNNITLEYAKKFLLSHDQDKENSIRLLVWLLFLGKLKPGSNSYIFSQMHDIYVQYLNFRSSFFDNSLDDPLSKIQKNMANLITADILRSVSWFNTIASQLGLDSDLIKDASLHAYRVLTILSVHPYYCDNFIYTQGFDRFFFVAYTLGLSFCQKTNLPIDFSEACAFEIIKLIIPLVEVSNLLDNLSYSTRHFSQIDKQMKRLAPQTYHQLSEIGLGSFHFALRWELLLFADEHDINSLLLIWDQIIVRKNDFRMFLANLCLAHIVQVKPVEDATMVEKLQHFKDWDNEKLLNDAISSYQHQKRKIFKRKIYYLTILVVFILFVTLYFNKYN